MKMVLLLIALVRSGKVFQPYFRLVFSIVQLSFGNLHLETNLVHTLEWANLSSATRSGERASKRVCHDRMSLHLDAEL